MNFRKNYSRCTAGAAMFAIAAIGATLASGAENYVWTGAASATWDSSSLNWTNAAGTAVRWVDGNNAVFPAGANNKTITVSSDFSVADMNVKVSGYTFAGSGKISASGKVTLSDSATFNAARFGGSSVRIGGSSNKTLTFWGTNAGGQSLTRLENDVIFVPSSDDNFGPVPANPAVNIEVLSGMPCLNLNSANLSLHANRSISVASGATLRLGTAKSGTVIKGVIMGTPDATLGFATNSVVYVPNMWSWTGNVSLNPGTGRTNDVGRLRVENNLKLTGGTTRVGAGGNNLTGQNAPLYVSAGSGVTAFSSGHGNLLLDGATLYCSQSSKYAEVSGYGQMMVTNNGNVYMPNVQFNCGNSTPGVLTVAKGGVVTVKTLKITDSTSSTPSVINLNEGGTIAAESIGIDAASDRKGTFTFNGGTIKATSYNSAASPFFRKIGGSGDLTEAQLASVRFNVGAKGAVFDTTTGNKIWWNRPLESSAATDGGLSVVGNGGANNELIMMAANTYNGATTVSNATLTIQADYALPNGTALNLVGGTVEMRNYSTSPSRDMTNSLSRIAGYGTVKHPAFLSVAGSIAPDAGKTIEFTDNTLRSLSGNFELKANATECGCIKFGKKQNISNLVLVIDDISTFNNHVPRGTYKILNAPSGYTGTFSLGSGFPEDKWSVRYTSTAAYLDPICATTIIMR